MRKIKIGAGDRAIQFHGGLDRGGVLPIDLIGAERSRVSDRDATCRAQRLHLGAIGGEQGNLRTLGQTKCCEHPSFDATTEHGDPSV